MHSKVEVEVERKIKTTTLNIQIIYILFVTRAIFCPWKTVPTGVLDGSKSPFKVMLHETIRTDDF